MTRMAAGEQVWLGLDIGGTKVAAALVDGQGRVRESLELPTLADAPFAVSFGQVVRAARTLLDRAAAAGIRV
ncbi:MAG: ROK family protein, partial [Bacillota bacterium]